MNEDGTNERQITNTTGTETYPSWSPDNSKIVCRKILKDGNWEVYLMNSDGSNGINLSNNPGIDGWLVWSPDGKRIAYASEVDNRMRIFVMNVDGTNKIQVSDNVSADDRQPCWNTDGTLIYFARYIWFRGAPWYEASEIYVTRVPE